MTPESLHTLAVTVIQYVSGAVAVAIALRAVLTSLRLGKE